MRHLTIALVGHPNCGKTTLFNALTGLKQVVGNWPGVTVEGTRGRFVHRGVPVEVVDLPGTYTLTAPRSLDEQVTAEAVAGGGFDLVLSVTDAAAPERGLYMTAQIIESQAGPGGAPVLCALNRMDKAAREGLEIDFGALGESLGIRCAGLSAASGAGVEALKDLILETAGTPATPFPAYDPALLERLDARAAPSRWQVIRHLEASDAPEDHADATALGAARAALAARAIAAGVHRPAGERVSISDRIDRVVLHPWLGVPVFLGAMYLMFLWTIHVGGAFVDAFDGVFGALLVDGLGLEMRSWGAPDWLTLAIADGLGRGIQTIATFIPIIACLYLFLSTLEESGYMARAAVVMDRFMRGIGLPGKAFVPLIVGLGCNVPAVMAARTLEEDSDRKATIAMTPFMSCGARLPVYALFAAAFFPTSGQNLVFLLYLTGIAVAVLTGYVLKRTLFGGAITPLLVELPSYQAPTLRTVVRRTGDRVASFVLDAGKVIVPVVMILSVLNAVTADGRVVREGSEDTLLASIGRATTPLFAPIGMAEDNWPAAVGLFTGVFAKEAVVGTLNALYTAELGKLPAHGEFDLGTALGDALATVPQNLSALAGAVLDPLGLDVGDLSSLDSAAADQGVDAATFGAMVAHFDGAAGAFAYMVFILLYAPCVATVAAIKREAGGPWTAFTLAWTTGMGFLVATVVYQGLTIARHPGSSAAWIAGCILSFALVVAALRRLGGNVRLKAAITGPACAGCNGCRTPEIPLAGKGGGCH